MGFFDDLINFFKKDTHNTTYMVDEPKQFNHQTNIHHVPQHTQIKSEYSNNPNLMEVNLAIVGLKYDNENGVSRQDILRYCKVGDKIQLVRTPMEKYPNAIQVTFNGECIGYISEDDNKRLAKYLDKGGQIYDAQISYMYTNSKNIVSTCEIIFWRNKMR